MMLDIDGVLTSYEATTADVLAAAQQIAVSAVGDLVNKSAVHADNNVQWSMVNVQSTEALHRAADAIAEQIREALHKRIDQGKLPDW